MTRYKLIYKPSAIRDLQKLPRKIVDAVISFCEGPLLDNPYRVGKPLINKYAGFHTAKRGSYRIVYEIREEEVVVYVAFVGSRADVYRPRG